MTKTFFKHVLEGIDNLIRVENCGLFAQMLRRYVFIQILVFCKIHDQKWARIDPDGFAIQLLKLPDPQVVDFIDVI
jgi:hypothetical protein